jgi:hypothetical protein
VNLSSKAMAEREGFVTTVTPDVAGAIEKPPRRGVVSVPKWGAGYTSRALSHAER